MQASETLGHMTVPADKLMRLEDLRQLFRPKFLPLDGSMIRAQQCRNVLQMMKGPKLFAAEDAGFSFVPFRDNVPHETSFGVGFNLLQALLATVLALGPAGTLLEAQSRFRPEGSHSGLASRDIDRFGRVRLRAGDESF